MFRASIFIAPGRHMQLDADQARHLAARLVIVHDLAHHVAVDHLDDRVATRNDMDVVPVILFDQLLQLIAVAERADRALLVPVADVRDHAAQREEAAAPFFVDLAGVPLLRRRCPSGSP